MSPSFQPTDLTDAELNAKPRCEFSSPPDANVVFDPLLAKR